MSDALKKILTAAVRIAHQEDEDHELRKIAQFGDEVRGAGVYRDSGHMDYRVMFVGDGRYLGAVTDYVCDDRDDAIGTAKHCTENDVDPNAAEAQHAEPVATQEETAPLPTRPRGFYKKPSKLLAGLLGRAGL